LGIQQFEIFLVILRVCPKTLDIHSQSLTNEELEDLAPLLIQKELQQEQEVPILWSTETHDLQEILGGIDRYLHKFGDIDPDREQSCSIRR
jgi:hypothetical protein